MVLPQLRQTELIRLVSDHGPQEYLFVAGARVVLRRGRALEGFRRSLKQLGEDLFADKCWEVMRQ